MLKVQEKCKTKGIAYSRLTLALRVAIYYMSFCGVTNTDIASAVVKPGGGSPSLIVVADTIAYASKNGGRRWDGTLPSGAGLPRSTTGVDFIEHPKVFEVVRRRRFCLRPSGPSGFPSSSFLTTTLVFTDSAVVVVQKERPPAQIVPAMIPWI